MRITGLIWIEDIIDELPRGKQRGIRKGHFLSYRSKLRGIRPQERLNPKRE